MRNEGAVQSRRSRDAQHEDEAASTDDCYSDTEAAVDRRVAEVKQRLGELRVADSPSALAVDGRGGARSEERTRGMALRRGGYVTFTEYFHGEGAIGAMSIMDNATAPGLTFMGVFDAMQDAHDLVTERHDFPPHMCDATAFYADPSALFVAEVVGRSAVPRQLICAAFRAWHGAGRR